MIASDKEKTSLIKELEEELSKHEASFVNQNQMAIERLLRENFELKQRLTLINETQPDVKSRKSLLPSDSLEKRVGELETENNKLRDENKSLSRIMEQHSSGKNK
jgi:hypothetical protein